MRIKFTRGLVPLAISWLALITIASGVRWANSSFASPPAQEKKKRNLKDEALIPIDAAPEEHDADKREARTKKNKRFNKSKRANVLEEQKDGEVSGTILETEPPALPVTSDLVVIGTIQRRQPYLAETSCFCSTKLSGITKSFLVMS